MAAAGWSRKARPPRLMLGRSSLIALLGVLYVALGAFTFALNIVAMRGGW
jgi:hypothetical protein